MQPMSRRDAIRSAFKLGLVALLTPQDLLARPASNKAAGRVTLVLVNDLDRMSDAAGRGGHAKLAAVARAERQRPDTFLIHAGDAYSPSILSGFDKGLHIVDLLNRIAPDVFVPGNHEFDFGPENFRARIAQSTFTCLAANISEASGAPVAGLQRLKLVDAGPFKIGFLGVCTEQTVTLSSPGPIRFAPAVETAVAVAAELRAAGADLVVAVTHMGFGDDMALVRSRAVDVVLSGHDHNLVTFWDGRVVLVESDQQADFVTPIDLLIDRIERDGGKSVTFVPRVRPIDTLDVAPDAEIAAVIADYERKLDADLAVRIGTTATPLDTRRSALRGQENAFGNLVCDAMREAVAADVCVTNGGGIRADRQYEAGATLTRRTILEEMPFGNKTVLLEVNGAILRELLEHGLRGGGGFPQVAGLVVEADMSRPPGQRTLSITIAGRPLDAAANYKLATNDFLARGGDGFAMLAGSKVLVDDLAGQYVAGQVIGYITRKGTVAPKIEGRIVLR